MAAKVTPRRRGLVLAAALAGMVAMGAEPPPAPATAEARNKAVTDAMAETMAKFLPTPRLFEITRVQDGEAGASLQFCMGAGPMMAMVEASLRARAVDRKPQSGGCTHKIEGTAGGGFHLETTCDKAAGAAMTSRSVLETVGGMQEARLHDEIQADDLKPPRTIVSDTRLVQVGACPADLKPGEMRMADGTKFDTTGIVGRPAGANGAKP
jgi:hypothetical protein